MSWWRLDPPPQLHTGTFGTPPLMAPEGVGQQGPGLSRAGPSRAVPLLSPCTPSFPHAAEVGVAAPYLGMWGGVTWGPRPFLGSRPPHHPRVPIHLEMRKAARVSCGTFHSRRGGCGHHFHSQPLAGTHRMSRGRWTVVAAAQAGWTLAVGSGHVSESHRPGAKAVIPQGRALASGWLCRWQWVSVPLCPLASTLWVAGL